jgi:hypothetical protein
MLRPYKENSLNLAGRSLRHGSANCWSAKLPPPSAGAIIPFQTGGLWFATIVSLAKPRLPFLRGFYGTAR